MTQRQAEVRELKKKAGKNYPKSVFFHKKSPTYCEKNHQNCDSQH
jgi:hypothetical protein